MLLTLLMQALLRWNRIRGLRCLLGLQIGLVLQGLLLVCSHIGSLWGAATGHVALGHAMGHLSRRILLFLRRFNGGLGIDAIGVGRLWSVEACLCKR